MKNKIQQDLNNGMFYKICSNETTFREYIFPLIDQVLSEERERIVKDIKKINKSNEDITSYGDGFEDSIGQVLTCITNRKVKIIIN